MMVYAGPGDIFDGRANRNYVYMLLCQDFDGPVYVKVGVSHSPLQRLAALKTSCPMTPQRLAYAVTPTRSRAFRIERDLHKEMARWRNQGEWFRVEMAEKAEFNAAWHKVFMLYGSEGCRLKWEQIAVQPLLKMWRQNSAIHLRAMKKRGRAFKDFAADSRKQTCA